MKKAFTIIAVIVALYMAFGLVASLMFFIDEKLGEGSSVIILIFLLLWTLDSIDKRVKK